MRYHFERPVKTTSQHGETYLCGHPVYSRCTLYKLGNRGLAVIQQRYIRANKATIWREIYHWLTDSIYYAPGFNEFFNERAAEAVDGIYPTVTVGLWMWALKMKPLEKERWETVFDRRDI